MNSNIETFFRLIRIALGVEKEFPFQQEVDWNQVYRLAMDHGVCTMICDAVERVKNQNEAFNIDEDLWYEWVGQSMVKVMKCKAQWNDAQKLGAYWSESGLRPVVLKGFAYAQLYPQIKYRTSCDLDVFLFDDWERGNQLIEALGITVNRSYYKNSSFQAGVLNVENHKFCSPIRGGGNRKKYEMYLQGLLKDSSLEKINGTALLCPPPLFNVLFFMSHAQYHCCYEGGINMKFVCDWAMLMRKYSVECEQMWADFLQACCKFGMLQFAQSMGQVAKRVCGIPIPYDCPVSEVCDELLLSEILTKSHFPKAEDGWWSYHWGLIRGVWKSRDLINRFSDQSVARSLWNMATGYLFEKRPVLD